MLRPPSTQHLIIWTGIDTKDLKLFIIICWKWNHCIQILFRCCTISFVLNKPSDIVLAWIGNIFILIYQFIPDYTYWNKFWRPSNSRSKVGHTRKLQKTCNICRSRYSFMNIAYILFNKLSKNSSLQRKLFCTVV